MTRQEFQSALRLAQSGADLTAHDDGHLFGCALPEFQPIHTKIEPVARLLRWQCQSIFGQWDGEAIAEMALIARRKFLVV